MFKKIEDIFKNNGRVIICRRNGTISIITKEFTTEVRADGKSHCYETKEDIKNISMQLMCENFQIDEYENSVVIRL